MDSSTQEPMPRIPMGLSIEFRKSYSRQPSTGEIKNMSLSGAFLCTKESEQLNKNDKIVMTFKVSGRMRQITAKMIWKNHEGCGVAFIPFNNRDVQIIDDLMYFVENKRQSRRSVLGDIFEES